MLTEAQGKSFSVTTSCCAAGGNSDGDSKPATLGMHSSQHAVSWWTRLAAAYMLMCGGLLRPRHTSFMLLHSMVFQMLCSCTRQHGVLLLVPAVNPGQL
jgi:hypothetical protein